MILVQKCNRVADFLVRSPAWLRSLTIIVAWAGESGIGPSFENHRCTQIHTDGCRRIGSLGLCLGPPVVASRRSGGPLFANPSSRPVCKTGGLVQARLDPSPPGVARPCMPQACKAGAAWGLTAPQVLDGPPILNLCESVSICGLESRFGCPWPHGRSCTRPAESA